VTGLLSYLLFSSDVELPCVSLKFFEEIIQLTFSSCEPSSKILFTSENLLGPTSWLTRMERMLVWASLSVLVLLRRIGVLLLF